VPFWELGRKPETRQEAKSLTLAAHRAVESLTDTEKRAPQLAEPAVESVRSQPGPGGCEKIAKRQLGGNSP